MESSQRTFFPNLLLYLGLVLLAVWGGHKFLYQRSLALSEALVASYRIQSQQSAMPVHISVGDKINIPIVEAGKIGAVWTVSPTSANHVFGSARPGDPGNIIMYGHNINTIFGYLVDIKSGDKVRIRMSNGDAFDYIISDTHVVSVNQTELLAPTTHEILTLYTCTGLLDSLRFVARALPAARVNL